MEMREQVMEEYEKTREREFSIVILTIAGPCLGSIVSPSARQEFPAALPARMRGTHPKVHNLWR